MRLTLLAAFFLLAEAALATTITVTSNANSGAGTLRQALIDHANGDTVVFNLSAGNETITIASAFALIWDKGVTIDGSNTAGSGTPVTVQVTTPGASTFRIFEFRPYTVTMTVKNMTLRGGDVGASDYGGVIKNYSGDSSGHMVLDNLTITDGKSAYGGCVYVWGTVGNVSITSTTMSSCRSTSSSYGGGAIFFRSVSGAITLQSSTFYNNSSAADGGAIYMYDQRFTMDNCTVSSNTASSDGGGMYLDGDNTLSASLITNSTFDRNVASAIGGAMEFYYGVVKITNTTIFNNRAGTVGGGFYAGYGTITLTNNTVVMDSATSINSSIYVEAGQVVYMKNNLMANSTVDFYYSGGTVNDNGYNIVETATGRTFNATGDITGNQANLNIAASLASNGTLNYTQTLALSANSVAIDAGTTTANNGVTIPTTDQRGIARVGGTDIGACEYASGANTVPSASAVSAAQQTSGAQIGKVLVDYTLTDVDSNSGNLNTSTAQVQYAVDPYASWSSATIVSASTVTALTSTPGGTAHTGELWWDAAADLGYGVSGSYKVRLKPHDGTDYAVSYATSAAFGVDTVRPTLVSITRGDGTLTFVFSKAMRTATIDNASGANDIDTVLAPSAGHYGTSGASGVSWTSNTTLVVTLASNATFASGATVNPANAVTDAYGNADNTSAPGPALAMPAPSAPLSSVSSSSALIVSFSTVSADGYTIEASTASNFTGTLYSSSTSGQAASLTVQGLSANTTYYLRAGALWGQTTSYANTSPASRTTMANAPGVPSLSGIAVSSGTIRWVWSGAGGQADTFEFYYATGSLRAALSGSATYFLETNLSTNTVYQRFLKALNTGGEANSSTVTVATPRSQFAGVGSNQLTRADGEVALDVPSALLGATTSWLLSEAPLQHPLMSNTTSLIAAGVAPAGLRESPSSLTEFIIAVNGARVTGNFDTPVRVSVPYADVNGTGYVDGTSPPIRVDSLRLYVLNESSGLWEILPGSSVDTSRKVVQGDASHLSIFTAFGVAAGVGSGLLAARVYPVPYRPNGGIADQGKPYSASDTTSGIIFDNLPSSVNIKIYTLLGGLVTSFDSENSGGTLRWDARNAAGQDIASGGYVAVIGSPGAASVVKKILIIR